MTVWFAGSCPPSTEFPTRFQRIARRSRRVVPRIAIPWPECDGYPDIGARTRDITVWTGRAPDLQRQPLPTFRRFRFFDRRVRAFAADIQHVGEPLVVPARRDAAARLP